MNIGDFGLITREVEAAAGAASAEGREVVDTDGVTFTWFGETIRLSDDISPYNLSRFQRKVLNPRLPKQSQEKQVQAWMDAMDHLENWIHPEDFEKFDELAEKHGVREDTLGKVLISLYEALCARPTKRSSASSSGRSTDATTEPSSGKSSDSSPASPSPASTPRKRTPRKASPRRAATG